MFFVILHYLMGFLWFFTDVFLKRIWISRPSTHDLKYFYNIFKIFFWNVFWGKCFKNILKILIATIFFTLIWLKCLLKIHSETFRDNFMILGGEYMRCMKENGTEFGGLVVRVLLMEGTSITPSCAYPIINSSSRPNTYKGTKETSEQLTVRMLRVFDFNSKRKTLAAPRAGSAISECQSGHLFHWILSSWEKWF